MADGLSRAVREFEKNSLVVFSIMMIANLGNYLYQIIMGKLLTTESFGDLNTLLSLSMVLSVPAGILQLVATKYAASFSAWDEAGKASGLLRKLIRISAFAAMITFVIGLAFAGFISQVLHISQGSYIIFTMAFV